MAEAEDKEAELREKQRQRRSLSRETPNPQGEILPYKPSAFMKFFKPKVAKEGQTPDGQINMTNPHAFLDFFKPIKWIRKCPARREDVYSPPPPPEPGLYPPTKKKKKEKKKRSKKRRGWLCEQEGVPQRAQRQENFLNLTPEEEEAVRRNAERRKNKAEAKFNHMFKSYSKGLEAKKGHIMREMQELLERTDERHEAKFAMLYEKWRRQVYEHIQRQVEDTLDEMSPDYIKDKLRWYHYQYMAIANKQIILRDFPRADYDPFEPLKHTIKYSTKGMEDPVKHDLRKEELEKLFMGESVSDKPQTKETLPLPYWPAYHFRGTVHGHIEADEEDGSEIVIQQPEKLYSHDVLYNQVFVGDEFVKAEFPKGKYIVPNKGMLPQNHIDKPQGKAMVWDVECQTQPKLRIWYS